MAAPRLVIELSIETAELAQLSSIARSRTEPAGRVERARLLLAYYDEPSFYAVAQATGACPQTVQRCVERAAAENALAALDERPRPGRKPKITVEAKAWVVALACRKAKEFATRTSCGRLGCWPSMSASTGRGRGTCAWPSWPRGRCARSWTAKR